MERNSIPRTKRRHKEEIFEGPLKIFERGNRIYIRGTITVRGQSVSIRQSSGLNSEVEENWELAREIARKAVNEAQDSIIHGITPSPKFGVIVAKYLNSWDEDKVTDSDNIMELLLGYPLPDKLKRGQKQKARPLADVELAALTKTKIEEWYLSRFPNHAPATIRRHQNTLSAILKFASEKLNYQVPNFVKTKVKERAGRHMRKKLEAEEIRKLIEFAAPHLKPLLATLFVTGARVGMTLYLERTDFLIVRNGRDMIFFPDSKNDNAYERVLHDYAASILEDWLKSREDSYSAMFLTQSGKPYIYRKGGGGQIKTAFHSARKKLVEYLEEQGKLDRAKIVSKITPHWARHNFANTLRAEGADLLEIAEAGMWESPDVVRKHYMSDTPERVAKRVRDLDFGPKSAQSDKTKLKNK